MTKLIEWTKSGPTLAINQAGEKILLYPNASVTFEDFVGSHVCVKRANSRVTCEARVPESTGLCRWTFDSKECKPNPDSTTHINNINNLAALIAETRVGFNGRL